MPSPIKMIRLKLVAAALLIGAVTTLAARPAITQHSERIEVWNRDGETALIKIQGYSERSLDEVNVFYFFFLLNEKSEPPELTRLSLSARCNARTGLPIA